MVKENRGGQQELLDFDPERTFEYTHKYLCVPIFRIDGTELGTINIPAVDVEGKSHSEIKEMAVHTYEIFCLAEKAIDNEKIRRPEFLDALIKDIAMAVSIILAANIMAVYFGRAQSEEETEEITITVEADIDVGSVSREEATSLFIEALQDDIAKKLQPAYLDSVAGDKEFVIKVIRHIWRHIFALVLLDIEKDRGAGSIFSLPVDESERLFNEYRELNHIQYFEEAIWCYAQHIARTALESLKPSEMPIVQLRSFLGISLGEGIEGTDRVSSNISACSKMIELIRRKYPDMEMGIILSNEKVCFEIDRALLPPLWNNRLSELLNEAIPEDFFRERKVNKASFRERYLLIARRFGSDGKPALIKEEVRELLRMPNATFYKYMSDDPTLHNDGLIVFEEAYKKRLLTE